MKNILNLFLLLSFLLNQPLWGQKQGDKKVETVSDRLIAFNSLDKITVGPEDNFQGVVDQAGSVLVFTRLAQQASSLFIQDLTSDKVQPFLSEQGDAKDPVLSPSSKFVAFTYFKNNSRGDICIRELKGSELHCLDSQGSADTEPFWLDEENVAFVSRDFRSDKIGLKSYNLKNKKLSSLYEGDVSAPTSFQNGKTIVFSALNKNLQKNTLFRLERGRSKAEPLIFDLPGMSSFPRMSADGLYLYFSQYMNDSNNDKTIDGKDNGVIFRAAFAKLQAGKKIFPEQMTSVETNCSYPYPGSKWLWVTCAYEGSLDIYKLPSEGIVPQKWNKGMLENAHQVARSYQDRILLLNTLRFRNSSQKNELLSLEMLLSNHMFLGESEASRYYLQQLIERTQQEAERLATYKMLNIWIDSERESKLQVGGRLSSAFEATLRKNKSLIQANKFHRGLQTAILANVELLLNNSATAASMLATLRPSDSSNIYEHYFTGLALSQLPDASFRKLKDEQEINLANAVHLDKQSRIYYLQRVLERTQLLDSQLDQRLQMLEKIKARLKKDIPLEKIVVAEIMALNILKLEDVKQKQTAFKPLGDLILSSKDDYFLSKAVYVRVILTLADGKQVADINLLSSVAGRWSSYTKKDNVEFAFAREQALLAALDNAYQAISDSRFDYARGVVQGLVGSTNDLEAHYLFVDSSERLKVMDQLNKFYEIGPSGKDYFGQARTYVEALLELIGGEGSDYASKLNSAIDKLENMNLEVYNPGMKFLLLGYCQMEKLRLEREGYLYDQQLAEFAHRNLMLAVDLGRDNRRLKASAYDNLSLLHSLTRNYSLSAQFLQRRQQLGFITKADELRFYWFYAKTLYYTRDYLNAAKLMRQGLESNRDQKDQKLLLAFAEREAFYLLQHADYAAASKLYGQLKLASYSELNRSKILLASGFALLKNGQKAQAVKNLEQAVQLFKKLAVIPQEGERLVAFQPKRQLLISYGLLAQASEDLKQQINYRTQRLQLLESMVGSAGDYYLKNEDVQRFIVKDQLNNALAQLVLGDKKASSDSLLKLLNSVEALVASSGSWTDQGLIAAMENYYSFALGASVTVGSKSSSIKPEQILNSKHHELVQVLLQNYEAAFKDIKESQGLLFLQKAKLGSLNIAYQHKFKLKAGDLRQSIRSYLAKDEFKGLAQQFSAPWQALEEFAQRAI